MNSEELEVSLRTEFENYLNNTLADMRQEISQLQEQVTAELERHKSQLDEVFGVAVSNFQKEKALDPGFRESVVEHLRLSRDEGAQITAMAIARAEEMETGSVKPGVGVKEIFEAVNDISSKTSQSEILKTLVHHATHFAPRGAFFIIKNDHLVGWRVFGKEKGSAEEKVREVFLPNSADSILSASVKSLNTVMNDNGGFADDHEVLQKLEFGKPMKMMAIPLVARGRGVAVLYADYGNEGGEVSVEALETLVRVAGLTVEVLASSKSAAAKKTSGKKAPFMVPEGEVMTPEAVAPLSYQSYSNEPLAEPAFPTSFKADNFSAVPAYEEPAPTNEFVVENSYSTESFSEPTPTFEEPISEPAVGFEIQGAPVEVDNYPAFETTSWSNDAAAEPAPGFSAQEFAESFARETDPAEYAKDVSYQVETNEVVAEPKSEFEFETTGSYQEPAPQEAAPVEEFVPTKEQTFGSFDVETAKTETVSAPVSTAKSRLSERNVDLPIEVSEDERRLHNDARRFARLLVSEIKLYNEQKVKEGRDSSDLYDRLKEAIDRSREMYDKRVQPAVAAKFDYFHYELVNTLAEGDDNKLGADYPGGTV